VEVEVEVEVEKFNDNLAAIRTLNQIEAEQRRATPDEQALLARYVGWGGLASRCAAASVHLQDPAQGATSPT
jgi:hypothetical protein